MSCVPFPFPYMKFHSIGYTIVLFMDAHCLRSMTDDADESRNNYIHSLQEEWIYKKSRDAYIFFYEVSSKMYSTVNHS
jgi:hypothetical protein